MGDYKEDTDRNFETTLFIILFSLFAIIISGQSETQTSASRSFLQNEPAYANYSTHFEATVFNAVSLPDLYKNFTSPLHNSSLNLFSLQNKISGYNQRITQNLINIRKTSLVIEPLFLWRLFYPPSFNDKEVLPVSG